MASKRDYDYKLVAKACLRWLECFGYDDSLSAKYAFATFLGYPYKINQENIVDTNNPEVIRLIDLINGPNGITILKMMDIKNKEVQNGDSTV